LENLRTLCRNCHHIVESAQRIPSALAGLAHAIHNLAPFFLMCSPHDIEVISEQRSTYTKLPTITIYDCTPGGLGLSTRLYELHPELLKGVLEMIRDCTCADGCPACIGPVNTSSSEVNIKKITANLLYEIS
jgi:DEAD/DEAH box helicase domain-containing protein